MDKKRLAELRDGQTFVLTVPVRCNIATCCVFMKLVSGNNTAVVIFPKEASQFRVAGEKVSMEFIPLDAEVYPIAMEHILQYINETMTELLQSYNPSIALLV